MAPTSEVSTEDIDSLLERYLTLLDEYTALRSQLTRLQSSIFQNIARANFSAERGIRYGQDMYDERMQCSRGLVITRGEDGLPSKFKVVHLESLGTGKQDSSEANGNEDGEKDSVEEEEEKPPKSRDPLRWFGILTPMTLRQAQGQAVETVEEVIPKLLTINAEMMDVEIRVRRARKKRAKAEAASRKEQAPGDAEGHTKCEQVLLLSENKQHSDAESKIRSIQAAVVDGNEV